MDNFKGVRKLFERFFRFDQRLGIPDPAVFTYSLFNGGNTIVLHPVAQKNIH